ncbi:hypothetical protein AHF37_08349 [Paragonimus kellicotti]|nr:hypothetical protein AHF37_08349 [Paragonimus kellicotti]
MCNGGGKMNGAWEKVLYKDLGVPDNFVSPHFLSELRKNVYIRKYSLWSVIVDAGCIYQQLCCIVTFVTLYFYLLLDWASPSLIGFVLLLFLTVGYSFFWLLSRTCGRMIRTAFYIRTGLIIFAFDLFLAPVLHSLLATVSTDTIYALTVVFLLVNWVSMDYITQSAEYSYDSGSNTTSLSSSLLAALCLASPLPTPFHTFVLIAAGTTLFALWFSLVHLIRIYAGQRGQVCLTVFSCVVSNAFLWPIVCLEAPTEYKYLIAAASIGSLICINFVGPWLLIRMQRIKETIHGPWDEATLES